MFSLVKLPTKYEESKDSLLAALKDGECVVLSINDKKMRVKKRVQHPVLMIAPASIYGAEESGVFLFSMPGYGSELIELSKIKSTQLYRIGMTMAASKILVDEIKTLFK